MGDPGATGQQIRELEREVARLSSNTPMWDAHSETPVLMLLKRTFDPPGPFRECRHPQPQWSKTGAGMVGCPDCGTRWQVMLDSGTPALEHLARDNERLRGLLRDQLRQSTNEFEHSSGVSDNGTAFVTFKWDDKTLQGTPASTRDMALAMLRTADAADFDAAVYDAMHGMGADVEQTMQLLSLIRAARGGDPARSA